MSTTSRSVVRPLSRRSTASATACLACPRASWLTVVRSTCGSRASTLYAIDPDMAVNIEHEDAELDQIEGLRLAAENLKAAGAAAGI